MTARARAVIYCRVSTDKQEIDGESLEYQEEKGRQYAELHNMDVVLVLHEAKSGFIHYTLREKLTIARQMIRDHLADVIIVFDLRRFSRNFVHSAMIFEEVESNGGEIVSVTENIDNSLTGKLVRSILAWTAESEREKIVEYANRHWQTRLAHSLPVGTGRAPYGWKWKDEDKTDYELDEEEAAVRFSIFEMFVTMDMSIRGIASKLTEDGILPPARSRGVKAKSTAWLPSTVHLILSDVANIGVLRILKTTKATTENGKKTVRPNANMKAIPGGLPRIISDETFALAQLKLRNNKSDKSHVHTNPEDFLLKGHVFCKTCHYRMAGRYRTSRKEHIYPYYVCVNHRNKYDTCPDPALIRTDGTDQLVWEDCCRVFERLEAIRAAIERNIEQSLQNMLENSQGKLLMDQLTIEIASAKQERDKHAKGSYYYQLIAEDIQKKEAQLKKYEQEARESQDIIKLSDIYRKSILGFLNFLDVMKGKYHEATFADKRNALTVLGVNVVIHPFSPEIQDIKIIETNQEWLTMAEASRATGIGMRTLNDKVQVGKLTVYDGVYPRLVHRDELNRFLRESPVSTKSERANIQPRLEISYSPIFTSV